MIVLAILDDVFESQIRSVEDIFRLRVRAWRRFHANLAAV